MSILCSLSLTVEVVTVLSCHSSCQGQVFSCTPFAFGKQCGFEEFCSLHDFVMACQSVLKDVLMAVHISSCFTLKLDCSHAVSVLLTLKGQCREVFLSFLVFWSKLAEFIRRKLAHT